ncbi:hypothetical protein FisN_16Lh148 [Fistulifera solaris]|uniref:Uncharacterized protein n=1 Tax=Fistulifera solaris TaxID=1519565 RepID=A0A1Z5KJ34_FISSO|nr:hypothetical protein FisN_16Lh148 [Fistulifera solaris]|eukprot:GAX26310.1 hypothetical protein FisN_16Lh148 [Fistulifera solaris]
MRSLLRCCHFYTSPLLTCCQQLTTNHRTRMRRQHVLAFINLAMLLLRCDAREISQLSSAVSLGFKSALARKASFAPPANALSTKENTRIAGSFFVSPRGVVRDRSPSSSRPARPTSQKTTLATIRPLVFWENMVCGAISRSVAQTVMHPANTCKTLLQSSPDYRFRELLKPSMFHRLSIGAGANLLLSLPHGAINFAVLEAVRHRLGKLAKRFDTPAHFDPALDFVSSCISTISCSAVSTPQMVIMDNIMAGNYPHLAGAITQIHAKYGVAGFYRGWLPGLMGKIPAYALTWTFFQRFKNLRARLIPDRPASNIENSIMGSTASALTVCIMIPVDTIKTRLVTQAGRVGPAKYKGIIDCARTVLREEGLVSFYRGLPPRLVSVVPMIGIQFGVYEAMKRIMVQRQKFRASSPDTYYGPEQILQETSMEVAASLANPFPAPRFLKRTTSLPLPPRTTWWDRMKLSDRTLAN